MKKAGMMTGYLVFLAALILRGPRCHTQEFSKIYSSLPLVKASGKTRALDRRG
jgi:hypothetical protein